MTRNEMRFSSQPATVDIERSSWKMTPRLHTTFNSADLVPFFCMEVLPGDSFQLNTSALVRMATSIHPTMDDAFLDTYYFYCPSRLVWEHYKEFWGENNTSSWIENTEYFIPQATVPANPGVGSIYDYFNLPLNSSSYKVNALPFRMYNLIYNEWFRDENLIAPLLVNTGDTEPNTFVLQKSCKKSGYFTNALPSPQRGPSVTIPVVGQIPIVTGVSLDRSLLDFDHPMQVTSKVGQPVSRSTIAFDSSLMSGSNTANLYFNGESHGSSADSIYTFVPSNLWGDTSSVLSPSINELRMAFQTQRYYERLARGGSRYFEFLESFFGTRPPDSTLQRPEYLGGFSQNISMQQIVQSSSTNDVSALGDTAGLSKTSVVGASFDKSFTEHGYIIGLATVRTEKTYSQGLDRHWSYRDKFDMYLPTFAHLGEQAILNKEIYFQNDDVDEEVFGYQEAWAHLRYLNSKNSGYMRPDVEGSLASWHYGEYYTSLPRLSADWIKESSAPLDRTLAVTSELSHQFIADVYFDITATRAMPLYSVPGLIDHY